MARQSPHNPKDPEDIVSEIRRHSHPCHSPADLQPLFDRIGDARIVMLGEASHGTHEYYTMRTQISKRLIEEKGFSFIAVEGDWPDCYRLNRFVKGYDGRQPQDEAFEKLHEFSRWPTWMWANWETAALGEWMRHHNDGLSATNKAGFYGLDVYSLWESMESIRDYLRNTDEAALQMAEEAFRCFEPYREDDGQSYARASLFVPKLCESEVVGLLREIRVRAPRYDSDFENDFSAEQNAMVAVNAEKYYRAMIQGGPESWNLRDSHMQDTLERLLLLHGSDAKAIVWAHNTHIGDARATDMAHEGMFNIGELARRHYGMDDVVLVGFGSYSGSVIAGGAWGAPMQTMPMPEAAEGSWEHLLHMAGSTDKLLLMDDFRSNGLQQPVGHRAIGVVYHPEKENPGNYVPSVLPERYDAFVYIDETQALHPLHIKPDKDEVADTFPFGV